MHPIRQHAFGGPDTLSYESVPDLVPADRRADYGLD